MMTTRTGVDHTAAMERWSRRRLEELADEDLSGYVLKKDSPSCGMERVKVFGSGGMPQRNGRGIFAAALLERLPNLPVEEEGRLSDPVLRENFIERVFAYQRLRRLLRAALDCRRPGRISHGAQDDAAVALDRELPAARPARRRRRARSRARAPCRLRAPVHVDPAHPRDHAAAYERPDAHGRTPEEAARPRSRRRSSCATIDEYRRGLVPLIVPLTLLRHHVRVHDVGYLSGQTYLEPHPRELMLRNHV